MKRRVLEFCQIHGRFNQNPPGGGELKVDSLSKLLIIPLILILLISVVALSSNGQARGLCGPTYTIQAGDSLASIAQTCGVSYASLIAANPQVKNPSLISPGQTIIIPQEIIPVTGSNSTGLRRLQIAPQEGPAGTLINVSGTGFPANTTLTVGAGIVDSGPATTLQSTTDANGSFKVELRVPANALPAENWGVFASQGSGNELITVQVPFKVTSPSTTTIYVVQPGDTLSEIAARYGTTVRALLDANPDITNPDLIYPGQLIILP
jgi:LysM repeat protein